LRWTLATLLDVRMLLALGLLLVAVVCGLLAAYAFNQVVNPPRCGSEEVMFGCHADLWFALIVGVMEVMVGFVACVAAVALVLRLRIVRTAKS
jgi:hypothetical protein